VRFFFASGAEKWQKQNCFCPDGCSVRERRPRSTNTRIWGLHLACNLLGQHDGCCSSGCLSKSKTKTKSAKKILNKFGFFFGRIAGAQRRGMVIMHGLVSLFLGVIALAIILFVIGIVALCVLIVATTTIMALIVSMTMVRLALVVIALIALMVIMVLVTAMMMVA
jgi:hypothetical protein